jgi:hypothetical protein
VPVYVLVMEDDKEHLVGRAHKPEDDASRNLPPRIG